MEPISKLSTSSHNTEEKASDQADNLSSSNKENSAQDQTRGLQEEDKTDIPTNLKSNGIPRHKSFLEDKICPIFLGVSGGSGSGKTTICRKIISTIGLKDCIILSLDSFYKGIDPSLAHDYNFDHPDALDFDLACVVVKNLLERKETEIPIYDFKTHSRLETWQKLKPCDLILFEGIFALYDERIRNMMNLKVFLHCDEDVRLYRRLLRDTKERGRTPDGILYQYNRFVKSSFDDFIKPTMKHADLIVPGGASNAVAINFIVQNLKSQLHQLGTFKNTIIDDNVYFYEIFDSHWLNINDKEANAGKLYRSKQIIFNENERNKFELVNLFKLLAKDFSVELYNMVIKRYMKAGLRMLRNHLKSLKRNWNPDSIFFIHFDMEFEDIKLRYTLKTKEVCVILIIFHYEKTNSVVLEKISQLKQENPDLKFYVVTAFSNIRNLTTLGQKYQDVLIVNSLCVVDFDELVRVLKKNCMASHINLFDEKFYHGKFMKLADRYMQKLYAGNVV